MTENVTVQLRSMVGRYWMELAHDQAKPLCHLATNWRPDMTRDDYAMHTLQCWRRCQIWISGWILPHFDVRTISAASQLKGGNMAVNHTDFLMDGWMDHYGFKPLLI